MKMNYSYNEMERAFECGRNFQLTGENNFKELIEELNKDHEGRVQKTYVLIPKDNSEITHSLTMGKKYYPFDITSSSFRIISDNKVELYCLFKSCAHIGGKDWVVGTDI